MDLLTKLAQNPSDPALVAEVRAMVLGLQNQVKMVEIKNQKLVLELAHLKRMRYGVKSEAWTDDQKKLFEDDADQDLAAVKAEIDANAPVAEPWMIGVLSPS